jgi:hypothetical protein
MAVADYSMWIVETDSLTETKWWKVSEAGSGRRLDALQEHTQGMVTHITSA